MKIKHIKLKGYKRFTDLTIQELPETACLVVLIGPNGCGKSSLFDAFLMKQRALSRGNFLIDSNDKQYYSKGTSGNSLRLPDNGLDLADQKIQIQFHSNNINWKKSIYIRSAYRNEPDLQLSRFKKMKPVLEEDRFDKMIQNDVTVSKNYQRMTSNALENVFEKEDPNTTIGDFRKKTLDEIRRSMYRLFKNPTLVLNTLGNPLQDGTFRFDKGESKNFPYQNLSAGEKSAFDLLLDLFVKKSEFDDTVFCIDEPEAHMSTQLQARLLKELYSLIPSKSQLWIATHSAGMMRKAYDLWKEDNASIVFLDFNHDFDKTKILTPIKPNRAFWENIYATALGDLGKLIAPDKVILCEGSSDQADQGFDASCYNKIFCNAYPEILFISVGGSNDVKNSEKNLIPVIKAVTKGVTISRLIDRDDNAPEEVKQKEREGIMILNRRNIESYLLDDEVLKSLCEKENKTDKISQLLKEKEKIIKKNQIVDNLKPVAGEIYNKTKEILGLTNAGNDQRSFMQYTLAPLITKEMTVYKELENIIKRV